MPRKSRLAQHHEHIEKLYLSGVGMEAIAILFCVKHTTLHAYLFKNGLPEKKRLHQVTLINAVAAEMRAAKHGLARAVAAEREGLK